MKQRVRAILKLNILSCLTIFVLVSAGLLSCTSRTEKEPGKMEMVSSTGDILFFDDMNYTSVKNFEKNGWIVRDVQGWPGVQGAMFEKNNVSFHKDKENGTNSTSYVKMTSRTDGTIEGTSQTQICHERKYLYGTYAARVRFYNEAATGKAVDQTVQSFYAITPSGQSNDPLYSEMDFEYLANGGWGAPAYTLYNVTWEKVQFYPWQADNANEQKTGRMEGWHVLVIHANEEGVRYFVDGSEMSIHPGYYSPESPMSINFNLWFIAEGWNGADKNLRSYQEDIDWVLHVPDRLVDPTVIPTAIADFRTQNIARQDTVPVWDPPLDCGCDL